MATGLSEEGDIGFQIAPMVDVVFVLLLFFMAAAGSQIIERELNIRLPSGRSAAQSGLPLSPIVVDILPDGTVKVNDKGYGKSKELTEFRAWLKETIARFGDEDPVIIRPAMETRHERIMDVLNAASAAGVTKLSFS